MSSSIERQQSVDMENRERPASYMDSTSNTVGQEGASAAIARGEVGANYSRYSMPQPPSNLDLAGGSTSMGRDSSDDGQLEYLSAGIPELSYGALNSPVRQSLNRDRLSSYGPVNGASQGESPGFRDSVYSVGGADMYFKPKEDTELLWNEKNVEADECVSHIHHAGPPV